MDKKDIFVKTAFEIGTSLCRSAKWFNNRCNWVDRRYNEQTQIFFYAPLPVDFYDGSAGISFFLFNLYAVTGEKIFKTTAEGALQNSYEQRNLVQSSYSNSFYQGKAGLTYVMIKAFEITKDKAWKVKALELFDEMEKADASEMRDDLVCGIAGIIPVFILGAKVLKKKSLMETANELTNLLIGKAISTNQSMSWNYNNEFEFAHTGFAHGSSGMAYTFLIMYKHQPEEKYLSAAQASFNYDDSFYNRDINGWQRLNDTTTVQGKRGEWQIYPSMWCYGSAGIGISKLFAWLITKEQVHKDFLLNAINRSATALQLDTNFGLCHGHFSNAELLLTAGQHLKNKKWKEEALRVAEKGIDEIAALKREWFCGGRGGYQTLGFMNGVAGIGNFYLRLVSAKVQSGLFLEELL